MLCFPLCNESETEISNLVQRPIVALHSFPLHIEDEGLKFALPKREVEVGNDWGFSKPTSPPNPPNQLTRIPVSLRILSSKYY